MFLLLSTIFLFFILNVNNNKNDEKKEFSVVCTRRRRRRRRGVLVHGSLRRSPHASQVNGEEDGDDSDQEADDLGEPVRGRADRPVDAKEET